MVVYCLALGYRAYIGILTAAPEPPSLPFAPNGSDVSTEGLIMTAVNSTPASCVEGATISTLPVILAPLFKTAAGRPKVRQEVI